MSSIKKLTSQNKMEVDEDIEDDTSSVFDSDAEEEEEEEEEDEEEEMKNNDEDEDDEEEQDKSKQMTNSMFGEEEEEDENEIIHTNSNTLETSGKYNSDDEEEEENDDLYLQKFNSELNKNYLVENHPEAVIHNENEIMALTKVIRDKHNNIVDDLHRTIPYLTKYEKTRILGQRAKQINSGAKAFVQVPEKVIDGYLIAQLELREKRIPFIVRRPIPGGGCEYWNLKDLEFIDF